MHVDELRAELLRPSAYGHSVEDVGFLQTHISLLFFAGKRVYKVKKPVDFGFLDFTTLGKRRHFCEEEVRLNRRLAPSVYRGVVPILRGRDGHLLVGRTDQLERHASEAVEFAVEMERLPAGNMLARRLERALIDNAALNAVVEVLVEFHEEAPTGEGVDEHGSYDAVLANVVENFAQLEDHVVPAGLGVLSRSLFEHLENQQKGFLAEHSDLLAQRVRRGRIRDGHGDLHAENICLHEGELVAYDCIEFSRRFRCADVACDLAFLAMDLDQRGFPAFSSYLVWRYEARARDKQISRLMPFYKTYRAIVRGKVAALTASAPDQGALRRAELCGEARGYLHLAACYGLPPALVLLTDDTPEGRTARAHQLARPLRAAVLHHPEPAALVRDTLAALGKGRSAVVEAASLAAPEVEELLANAAERELLTLHAHLFADEKASSFRSLPGLPGSALGHVGDSPSSWCARLIDLLLQQSGST